MLCSPSQCCANLASLAFSVSSPICHSVTSRRTRCDCRDARQYRTIRCEASSSPGQPKPLVIVGSLNADSVLEVDRLPDPGETMSAKGLTTFPGGKVAARQGSGRVRLA